MPTKSTLNDLKAKIAGNYFILKNRIQNGPNLQKLLESTEGINENYEIIKYASSIPFLDFNLIENNNEKTISNRIRIESNDQRIIYQFEFQVPEDEQENLYENIDSIKFMLENLTSISYDELFYIDEKTKNKFLTFRSSKNLFVTINGQDKTLSYSTTVKQLREMYYIQDSITGIIINDRFLINDSDFLIKFNGNPLNDEKTRLSIKIIRPNTNCRLCKFHQIQSNLLNTFIIPSFFMLDQIAVIYFNVNNYSMQFFTNIESKPLNNINKLEDCNSSEFYVSFIEHYIIKYNFIDEKIKCQIELTKEDDTKVKDILLHVSKKFERQFYSFDPYVKNTMIDLWEPTYNFIDQIIVFKTYKYQPDIKNKNDKYLLIYDALSNTFIKCKNRINSSVQEIIQYNNLNEKSDVSLFLNFHKLSPNDKPILLIHPHDFLILNQTNSEQILLNVSNSYGIKYNIKVESDNFETISSLILNDFKIKNENVSFVVNFDESCAIEQKQIVLPFNFDLNSFPKNSKLSIYYCIIETSKFTFCFKDKQNKISLSDPSKSINELKNEILCKLKIFTISPNSIQFNLFDTQLNQSQTFNSYGISSETIINIKPNENSIKIEIFLFNNHKIGDYFVSNGDEIKDLINLLKLQYEIEDIKYKLNLYTENKESSKPIDPNTKISEDGILFASFKKVEIVLLDPKKGEIIEVDEIEIPSKSLLQEILKKNKEIDDLLFYTQENQPINDLQIYSSFNCHYNAIVNTKKKHFEKFANKHISF